MAVPLERPFASEPSPARATADAPESQPFWSVQAALDPAAGATDVTYRSYAALPSPEKLRYREAELALVMRAAEGIGGIARLETGATDVIGELFADLRALDDQLGVRESVQHRYDDLERRAILIKGEILALRNGRAASTADSLSPERRLAYGQNVSLLLRKAQLRLDRARQSGEALHALVELKLDLLDELDALDRHFGLAEARSRPWLDLAREESRVRRSVREDRAFTGPVRKRLVEIARAGLGWRERVDNDELVAALASAWEGLGLGLPELRERHVFDALRELGWEIGERTSRRAEAQPPWLVANHSFRGRRLARRILADEVRRIVHEHALHVARRVGIAGQRSRDAGLCPPGEGEQLKPVIDRLARVRDRAWIERHGDRFPDLHGGGRSNLHSVVTEVPILVVGGSFLLHFDGPIGHVRHGRHAAAGTRETLAEAAIWLGERTLVSSAVGDEELFQLLLEGALRIVEPRRLTRRPVPELGAIGRHIADLAQAAGEGTPVDVCEGDLRG